MLVIKITIKKSKKTSLSLLNINALIAAFKVPLRVVQKFIKKKDVRPISSHPKNINIQLSATTRVAIEITNQFIKSRNLSALGSFLK